MRQAQGVLSIDTRGKGFYEITADTVRWVADSGLGRGLLTLFCRHTSASLTIQENADPDVMRDLSVVLDRLAPENGPYRHVSEGPDDMPAHVKAMLTGTSLTIPVDGGRPVLGTWQGVYLVEHRARPHQRQIVLHLLGE